MQVDFDAVRTIIILLFHILHNDNIISTSVSEAVEIPTDEKYYRKCSFMCFALHSHSSYKEQTNI